MRDALGPGTVLGYCTNVHAGPDLGATLANLSCAAEVRRLLGIEGPMGVGLWLSAEAAREALQRPQRLGDRLGDLGLRVFTLNGFPYGDFHGPVVKHRVYEPSWSDPRRLAYTLDLIEVMSHLLDDGGEGSISTLPVGWPAAPCAPVDLRQAAANLHAVASRLERVEEQSGRLIHLDLEPEPGCVLQTSSDAVGFWQEWLLGDPGREAAVRRYLRVCHDICHAAVVFEDQGDALARYRSAGLLVGKVQISSAICARFDALHGARRARALRELRTFGEARYLHQTTVRTDHLRSYSDLPEAVGDVDPADGPRGEWRVHFHVPVHLDRIGSLHTSREQIAPCVALAREAGVRHFEAETYAWSVLPSALRPSSLTDGIADELRWVMSNAAAGGRA